MNTLARISTSDDFSVELMEVGSATGNPKILYLPKDGTPIRTAFPPHIIQYLTDLIDIPEHVPLNLVQFSIQDW